MLASQLLSMGYAITAKSGDPPQIHTKVHDWPSLSWAHRTALRARLGTDDDGELTITAEQLAHPQVRQAVAHSEAQADGMPLPRGTFPGVDDRLKTILDAERCELHDVNYDDTGLHHEGPDGSLLYTSENFWGPLNPGYPEIQEGESAQWDMVSFGVSQSPYWATPAANGLD